MRFKSDGFTMIELAIVMAIAVVLTTMAIGGITGMLQRTNQQQAKSHMSLLYSSMKIFHSDWDQYFGDWNNLEMNINGTLKYRVGFQLNAGTTSPPVPDNYIGPGLPSGSNAVAVNSNHASGYCGNGDFPCTEDPNTICSVAAVGACMWSTNQFLLCSCSLVTDPNGGSTIVDSFTLNHKKEWTHTGL